MVDLHTHILPGIDDGARVMDESLDMLNIAAKTGTDKLAVTPHLFNPRIGNVDIQEVRSRFGALKNAAAENGIKTEIFLGSEVFCSDEFLNTLSDKNFFTLNGTDYLLVEFPFEETTDQIINGASAVINAGYRPIIAHPERYKFLRHNEICTARLIRKGCLFQLNTSSLAGVHGRSAKEFSMWMLENRVADFVSSDAHDTEFRSPDIEEAFMWIYKVFSKTYAEDLFFNNPQAVLSGKDINKR